MKEAREVKLLEIDEIDIFYPYFQKNIDSQFPEFSPNTRKFFIKGYAKDKLRESIKNGEKYILVTREGDSLIGFLAAYKTNGGVSYCEWLAVDNKYHHKGVGTSLLKAYEEIALESGAHKIHLWTADKNVAFYEKNGYILAGRIPDDYFGTDNNLMYKSLQKSKEENFLRGFLKQ